MRKEAKLLLEKSIESLVFSIEIFNRPHNEGRITGSLIFLDHSFEMLLKAGIIDRGGAIREKRGDKNTIGFDACVRKALSDGKIKFLRFKMQVRHLLFFLFSFNAHKNLRRRCAGYTVDRVRIHRIRPEPKDCWSRAIVYLLGSLIVQRFTGSVI